MGTVLKEKELLEREASIYGSMRELLDNRVEWTTEDETNWAQMNADYDEVRAQIDKIEQERRDRARLDEIRDRIDARGRAPIVPAIGTPHPGSDGGRSLEPMTEQTRALAIQAWVRTQMGEPLDDAHRDAIEATGLNMGLAALRFELDRRPYDDVRDMIRLQRQVYRALGTSPDAEGGYTVPETMVRALEIALLDFSGVRRAADVMRTASGEAMPWPTTNDTSNEGEILAENAQVGEQDVVFGEVRFVAYKITSKLVRVSQELIEDNAVNLVVQLGRLLGERIGRAQNRYFTVGTGSGQPQGITQATVGKTAASATAITGDELIDLQHSVDPAYREQSPSWQLHDTTLSAVRKLKDTTGAYLWQPGLQLGLAPTILGAPYQINNHMPTIAANAIVATFGAMSYYKIRDVAQVRMRRLVERYADYDQEGFVGFARCDGRILDAGTGPIKTLQMAAS